MSSSFIVRFKSDITEDDYNDAVSKFEGQGGKISHHHTLFKGFSGALPTDKVTTLDSLPNVEGIEKDQEVHVQ